MFSFWSIFHTFRQFSRIGLHGEAKNYPNTKIAMSPKCDNIFPTNFALV